MLSVLAALTSYKPQPVLHIDVSLAPQEVLKAEYPKGVDVVYEGVGGDMFVASLNALAPRGRLLVIGMMSAYAVRPCTCPYMRPCMRPCAHASVHACVHV